MDFHSTSAQKAYDELSVRAVNFFTRSPEPIIFKVYRGSIPLVDTTKFCQVKSW